ncbi:hypothetical protein TNCV_530991 [Trichonephila clavipes]|nr:hypothetical protein TNCV_530991 [Trichonephila clavipes]
MQLRCEPISYRHVKNSFKNTLLYQHRRNHFAFLCVVPNLLEGKAANDSNYLNKANLLIDQQMTTQRQIDLYTQKQVPYNGAEQSKQAFQRSRNGSLEQFYKQELAVNSQTDFDLGSTLF